MTISIPDTLTADSSERYTMSIRLWSGGLSFSGHVVSTDSSFFYREVPFDRGVPYISSLKECFFANECLSWPYKQLSIICTSPHYLVVPTALFPSDTERQQAWMRKAFVQPESACLSEPLSDKRATLLYDCEETVLAFCLRSFQNPRFTHYLAPLSAYWRAQSKEALYRCMYVWIEGERMDVACFEQERLLLVNTFTVHQPEEMLYYLLYVWRQMSFNAQVDALRLQAVPSLRMNLLEQARRYLRNVQGVNLPAELYLLGEEVVKAPLDLIALLVCES